MELRCGDLAQEEHTSFLSAGPPNVHSLRSQGSGREVQPVSSIATQKSFKRHILSGSSYDPRSDQTGRTPFNCAPGSFTISYAVGFWQLGMGGKM